MKSATRKTVALALVCLHCFTLTADAANYFVNYTTGSDSNNGTSAGTAWKTILKANANAVAGDVVKIAANDTIYAHPIQPRANNTTWIGDSTARHTVKVPGLTNNKRFTLVNGIRIFGGVTNNYANSDSTGRYLHLRNSEVVGTAEIRAQAPTFHNVRFGIGRGDYTSRLIIMPIVPNGDSLRMSDCTMNLRLVGTPGSQHLLDFQPDRALGTTMQDWSVTGNVCTLTITAGQVFEKTAMVNRLQRASFTGNSWLFVDSCGLSTGPLQQAWVVRDSVKLCKFTNETIEMRSPNGTGRSHALIYSSGSQWPDSANSWKFCTFKSNVQLGGAPAFYNEWVAAYRDSFYRNVVVCNSGNPCWQFQGAKDSVFVYRNTFVNLGGGAAYTVTPDGNTASAWGTAIGRFAVMGNIFYAKGGVGAQDLAAMPTFTSGLYASNYNLHFLPIPNGQDKAFRFYRWGQGPATFRKVGIVNGSGLETNSTWGSPAFEDSTYDTFDADIQQHSAARGVGPSGVDAGARDYSTPPPSVVTSLQVASGSSSSLTLSWTAPGANGDVGTATSYTLKASLTEFTEENFDATGSLVSTSSPQVAGSTEVVTVENLTQNVTYYFALKASNGTTTSGMSNVASGRTFPAGSFEP